MSRIGKMPIALPSGVTFTQQGNEVDVKGKNGELKAVFSDKITIKQEGDELILTRANDQKETKALHGLTRALLANMVKGVSEGFEKTLEIVGVGYRVTQAGNKLTFMLGYTNPVEVTAPDGITFEVPNQTTVVVKGIDKQKVGESAAQIRKLRPPEPYKGKGIRYKGEYVRRKVGKTGM